MFHIKVLISCTGRPYFFWEGDIFISSYLKAYHLWWGGGGPSWGGVESYTKCWDYAVAFSLREMLVVKLQCCYISQLLCVP